jgi:hypothetical protein
MTWNFVVAKAAQKQLKQFVRDNEGIAIVRRTSTTY